MVRQDIDNIARGLIRAHGDYAPVFAALEADACMATGDMEGAYHWRRVIACIEDMTASRSEIIQ